MEPRKCTCHCSQVTWKVYVPTLTPVRRKRASNERRQVIKPLTAAFLCIEKWSVAKPWIALGLISVLMNRYPFLGRLSDMLSGSKTLNSRHIALHRFYFA